VAKRISISAMASGDSVDPAMPPNAPGRAAADLKTPRFTKI
jgi:hypothetical protein